MKRAVLALLLGSLLGACSDATPELGAASEQQHVGAAPPAALVQPPERGPGETSVAGIPGFLTWESNRSGGWRLWIRDLEGGEPRQLTPDERGRRHCCPHISPDGAWITYLSLPDGKQEYSEGASSGPLRLIRPEGSEEREVAAAARTYFEHRAAVWRSDEELIYIDGEGRTVLANLATGERRRLTEVGQSEYGWLIDRSLSWATKGRAEFAAYRKGDRTVVERYDHRGCQPYFSHDGRWGFWTAGVGGPINRFDLATGKTSAILHKNDERMPPGLGYLYFPMLSRDGSMLAFAASPDQHDHFRSDYEIFVAEVDSELELTSVPIRMTDDPATDRFPDVWVAPLPLGRARGEAPLAATWRAPSAGAWRWDFGDGTGAEGERAEHTYAEPGSFEVTAALGDLRLRGRVRVEPATPPAPVSAALRERGSVVEVVFDEPLGDSEPEAALASGASIGDWSLSEDGRTVRFAVEPPLRRGDTLRLSGFVDRAGRPNRMAPAELRIEPPLWPSNRDGLAFVWAHGGAQNLVFDPELGADRAATVEPSGRSVFDHDFAMVLGRGTFVASERDAASVLETLRAANRMSLEATVTPGASGGLIGMGGLHLNFVLRAEAGKLHFSVRTGNRGPGAYQGAAVASYAPGDELHLVVTYAPGELRAYVDGEPAGAWPISGDFFHWKRFPLVFGEGVRAAPGTTPRLEGVAIYGRLLDGAEARENYLRYRSLREARRPVPRSVVEAELMRSSRAPSLAEISPYTEALAVEEWRVVETISGERPGGTVRVARWAILDSEREPAVSPGTRRRLALEEYDRNPQLEGVFVADDLPSGGGPLYYSLD